MDFINLKSLWTRAFGEMWRNQLINMEINKLNDFFSEADAAKK